MIKIWKQVNEFRGLYDVSNYGEVKSLNYKCTGMKKILKPTLDKYGYPYVVLYDSNFKKTLYIHRIVAIAFIPNPENKLEVNHKDLNKENNNVSNLEWNTRIENMNHYKLNKATK
jgi:hypothetical protein